VKHLLTPANRRTLAAFTRGRVLLAFDFDGTLAPLVAHAEDAFMRPRTAKLFDAVARRYPVVIVSGRHSRDVKRRLGQTPVQAVVGNHGADAATNRAEIRRIVAAARRKITDIVAKEPGSWIENKVYSISVHYKPGPTTARHLQELRDAVAMVPKTGLVPGKKVLNIVAAEAPDKGHAVDKLMRTLKCDRVFFVGDDETDERVFRHLPTSRLLGVRIGRAPKSRASFMLTAQADIDRLLALLIALREDPVDTAAAAAAAKRREEIGVFGESLEIMRTLWAMDHAMHRRSKRMRRSLGVTGEQRLALKLALTAPGLSAGDLSSLLHVHPSTLTGMMKRMTSRGLLKATADSADRRRLQLEVTPKGAKVLRDIGPTIEGGVEQAIRESGREELAAAKQFLKRLVSKI
jgi:trehalose 6-phosphate phosphatase